MPAQVREALALCRDAAAASAAQAGSGPPGPCRYPALIYVDRPIPATD